MTATKTADGRERADGYGKIVDFVRGLKGAAASILWILHLSGRPHTRSELGLATGYSDKTVNVALAYLAFRALIEEADGRCWRLTDPARRFLNSRRPAHGSRFEAPNPISPGTSSGPGGSPAGEKAPRPPSLEALFERIGIGQPAADRLLQRKELQADPYLALAWWWHLLTQDWPSNRQGLIISRLEAGRPPPGQFLALARLWPTVSQEDRREMLEMRWKGWRPGQFVRRFAERYPQMTVELFAAFMALYQVAPDELGYM